jgi:two-component system, chemotaxis family, sensor kinase CheA
MIDPAELTQEVLDTFFTEMKDHLISMETLLRRLSQTDERDPEILNSLYRSFHTVKGTSEMFGFRHISEFTHTAESLLSRVRNREIPLLNDLIDILLECKDHINSLLGISLHDYLKNDELIQSGEKLLQQLNITASQYTFAVSSVNADNSQNESQTGNETDNIKSEQNEKIKDSQFSVNISFHDTVFIHGLDPYPMIRYLNENATITDLEPSLDRLPPMSEFNHEKCYMDFRIELHGEISEKDIKECFEFAETECKLSICIVHAQITPASSEKNRHINN